MRNNRIRPLHPFSCWLLLLALCHPTTARAAPTVPEPVEPASGATLTNRGVVFSWEPAVDPNGDPVFYELVIFQADDLQVPVAARLAVDPEGEAEQDGFALLVEPLESAAEVNAQGGTVTDGVLFVAGRHGQGAQVAGSDSVRFPARDLFLPGQGTVELAVRLNRDISVIEGYDRFFTYTLNDEEQLSVLVAPQYDAVYGHVMHEGIQHNTLAPVDWTAGEWHHIAFAWGAEGQRLYLDGGQVAADPSTATPDPGGAEIVLGNDANGWGGIDAVLDDVRISRHQRFLPDQLRETRSDPIFLAGGTYRWQVRAASTGGRSDWSGSIEFQVDASAPKPLRLTDEVVLDGFLGFGAEWDAMFFQEYNLSQGVTEEDFQLALERIGTLGLSLVRMFVDVSWWEPREGAQDFEDARMISLYRQLQACQDLGVDVLLVIWRVPPWLVPYASRPGDLARTTADLLEELSGRGIGAVRYLILVNEPNLELEAPFSSYVALLEAMQERIGAGGLEVLLTGPDESGSVEWFEQSTQQLAGILEVFESHSYEFDLDSIQAMDDFVTLRLELLNDSTQARGKPFLIGEFGSSNMTSAFHSTDIETFGRGLFSAEGALRAMAAGTSGVLHWCLHDMYYYPGGKMGFGLWRFRDEGWSVRPIYHAWGLVSRLAPRGSQVLALDGADPRLVTAAVRRPDESVALWAVNRDTVPLTIEVEHAMRREIGGPIAWYRYEEGSLPQDDEPLPIAGHLQATSGRWSHQLPPQTLTAYLIPLEATAADDTPSDVPAVEEPGGPEEPQPTGDGDDPAAEAPAVDSTDSGCHCIQAGSSSHSPGPAHLVLIAIGLASVAIGRRASPVSSHRAVGKVSVGWIRTGRSARSSR